MRSRVIRALLAVIGIAIGCAAGYVLRDLDTTINSRLASGDSLREEATTLTATIADVRAGQIAYVARGQSEAFWIAHVESLLPSLQTQTADFAGSLTAPGAQAAFEPAKASLDNFRTLDRRVKEFVSGGNALLAADLIFSDGLEATATASTQVAAALNDELQAHAGELSDLRQQQLAVLGGAAGGILLVVLALAFAGAAPPASAEVQVAAPTVEPVRFEAPLPRAKPAITPKLVSTARLCGELARVNDSRQLPDLLERTAKVLEASGIIVWMADPAGRELRPAMSHGYSEQVMAKMGGIPRDATNAAAAAYRSSELRTVNGEGGARGAVVAPLLTAAGCVGVLSAEMKGGSEKDESSQALATIFAAQLATLVSPPATAAPVKAAAQG